jgi:SAM-dependent methyltransferase
VTRFEGFALDLQRAAAGQHGAFGAVEVKGEGEVLARRFAAGEPSLDIAGYLPSFPGADRCRFCFDLELPAEPPDLTLVGMREDGERVPLLVFPASELGAAGGKRWRELARRLRGVPVPPSEIVAVTQGGGDRVAYSRSVVGGAWKLRRLLTAAGHDPDRVRSVFDFGCGTGRLLLSWWLDDPTRTLRGCDVNPDLIGWSAGHLPSWIEVSCCAPDPPLDGVRVPDGGFDLVQCVSVCTHLSLERQRRWINELRRLLAPGGVLLLTLHGPTYVHLLAPPEGRRAFQSSGYWEQLHGDEGSNAYGTFHAFGRAEELLSEFEVVKRFPRGALGDPPEPFPLAMFQDVYLASTPA